MSDKKYYSVMIKKEMEVCVLAEDESDAEEIAKEGWFGWEMADTEVVFALEEYNDPEDAQLIQEFKDEDKYAE